MVYPFYNGTGWHKLHCKYWWLPVGLTCKSVSVTPFIRDTVKSKKLIKILDHPAANFTVRLTLLILSINDFKIFSPYSHQKNMSSMYNHHKYAQYLDYFIISSFSFTINKTLYGGANLVPIAALPCLCLSVFFLNVNKLFLTLLQLKSVETYFWLLSHFLKADILLMWYIWI